MILTPLNIQIAIIKAFYALAIKSIKYYTGLAFGKNNTCLFKEIRLLRAYVEILKNFEIVGSTITCSCCVEGTYNVLLNSVLPVTNVPIEFGCDNQGYIIYNNVGYDFTYWYDENNNKIVIDFTGVLNDVLITVNDIGFTSACDIQGDAVSPIEVATIDEITEPPVTVDNIYGTWNGEMTVYEPDGATYLSPPVGIIIPVADIDNPEAILELWNTTYPQWILQYFEGQYVLYTPFDNVNYTNYIVKFKQYEGGDDSFVSYYLASDSPTGLIPFVTVNTPAYADILFEQNTFVLSRRPETQSIPVPTTLPYSATATPAIVDILIPINQFALGQTATMTIPLYNLFESLEQEFYYQGSSMFSNATSLSTIQDVITLFNNNNGLGFTASNGGTQPINETLATALNLATIFDVAVPGDVYIAKLSYTILGIPFIVTLGQYTVGGDDVPADIASYLAADIIAQGNFAGTVTVNGTVITLTAPLGSGASWNTIYKFTLQKGVSGRVTLYPFSGGVGIPTIPVYILNIEAPSIYPESSYNGGVIEIVYPLDPYEPDGGQFAGGINGSPGVVTFDDSLTASTIYTSSTVFTSIEEMIDDFNDTNTLFANAVITGTISGNYNVRITVPSPPNAAYDFNGETLTYMYTLFSIYTYFGTYYNGSDITTSTYTLTVYNAIGTPGPIITNTGNFTDIQSILDEINADPTFNTNFTVFTGEANDIYFSTILAAATYNDYAFELDLTYTSAEYSLDNFTTPVEPMSGGVDRVAPNISLVNDFNAVTIYSLAQDSYNFNGINGFITAFNTPPTPYNYTATSQGIYLGTPEIRSRSLNVIPNQQITSTNKIRAYYNTVPSINNTAVLIGEFMPFISTDYTGAGIAAGLAANANGLAAPWHVSGGLASSLNNGLTFEAPLGTNGSFNNKFVLVQYVVFTRAIATITILTGSNGTETGQLKLGISGPNPIDFGTYAVNGVQTAAYFATQYTAQINSGTATHGYTANVINSTRIRIVAPTYSGTSTNGKQVLVLTATAGITTGPVPIFSGGSETPTDQSIISTGVFAGGGLTPYDKVRFTADPAVYTWEYNGSDLVYTNFSESPDYIYPGTFTGGNDNTAGQLFLELNGPVTSEILYQDLTPFNYASFQQWTTPINASSTNLDFSAASTNTSLIINSPLNSFAYFNIGYDLHLTYTYASPQWVDDNYSYYNNINNGVDPVLTPYEGIFASGVLGDFINTDPCTPTVVTQTCLTNSQVSKIITHINKLIK